MAEVSVPQGASAVFALALARQMRLTGEKSRVQLAASVAEGGVGWGELSCPTGVTAWGQRQREKCCSGNSVTALKKSGQMPATEVAGKAWEEIMRVKNQD